MTILHPYPEYNPSDIDWLGDIPSNWKMQKPKDLAAFDNGFAFKPSDWKHTGTPIIRIQNLNGSSEFNYTDRVDIPNRLRVQTGALLFSWSGNRGTSFGPFRWKRQFEGVLNQHIFRIRDLRLQKGYGFYILKAVTRHVEEQTHGIIGLVHITKPQLGSIQVPVPSLPEQQAIADFLDVADARISRYIAAKRRMIALLEEQKQAIINQAVTRGLDPDVPLKPSGVDWLGGIPAHWEVKRGSSLFSERNQTGFPTLPILEVSLVSGVTVRDLENSQRKQQMSDRAGYKRAEKGDLPYNMMRMWQGAVGVAPVTGLVSPAYVVLVPKSEVLALFFAMLFKTEKCKAQFSGASRGIVSDRDRLYWESFRQIHFAVPPFSEQTAIATYIERASRSVDGTAAKAKREIELIQEYRTRLISDVVTGKLDVRGVESPALDDMIAMNVPS